MFVLPLPGDVVESAGAVKHKVLSYSAYSDSPVVYVTNDNGDSNALSFSQIESLNGTIVKLTGTKVFTASTRVNRKVHLPQKLDHIVVDNRQLKVKDLKLRKHGRLSAGVFVIAEDERHQRVEVRLADVHQIKRAGEKTFKHVNFKLAYKDYTGSSK